ncbi:MAG: endonuclease [Chloroflexota bacterium]|nr:endonuclease [Chloroflexota bacterium]
MPTTSNRALVRAILRRNGRTYAEAAGIKLERNTPAIFFQYLCTSLLLSARISAGNALEAARALIEAGLTTPRKMAGATWQERVDVITGHGYKRYDERTSTMLGDTAALVLQKYGGDLRKLRDAAGRNVRREHRLLQEFKGIGPIGADIFLREVQVAWDEAFPYADRKVLRAARRLGLPADAEQLAKLVSRKDFPRLTAALIRIEPANEYDALRAQAEG